MRTAHGRAVRGFGTTAWLGGRDGGLGALVFGIGASLALAAFLLVREVVEGDAREAFQAVSATRVAAVSARVASAARVSASISALFAASDEVTREEFRAFARNELAHLPEVTTVAWAPRVPADRRSGFEREAGAAAVPGFRIHAGDGGGDGDRAGRAVHFPVFFLEPAADPFLLGYDMGARPETAAAIERARQTGEPQATGIVRLGRGEALPPTFLVFSPVYPKGAAPGRGTGAAGEPAGFATAVVRLDLLIERSLGETPPAGLDLYALDAVGRDAEAGATVFFRPSRARAARAEPQTGGGPWGGLSFETPLDLGGAWLRLVFKPAPGHFVPDRWAPWTVLLLGLALSALFSVSLVTTRSRSRRIENLAAGLRQANTALAREVEEHRCTAAELDRRAQALADSEQRFRDYTQSASDWFWEMGPDLRMRFISDKSHVSKRGREQVLGKTRTELAHDFDPEHPAWKAHLADLAARRPFRDFVYQVREPDGGIRWNKVSGKPIFDRDGTFLGYRGTSTDVTAVIEAERQAALAQTRLKEAIESFAGGFSLYDAEDRLVLCSRHTLEAYPGLAHVLTPGTRFETIIRIQAEAGFFADAVGRVEEWIEARLARHRKGNQTFETRMRDGRWREISEYRTADGGTAVIATDITERKRAEESLLRLAAIVESSNDAVWSRSVDGIITSWNKTAERIYGYSAEEVIGKPISTIIPPEARVESAALRERVNRGETITNQEVVRYRKDGRRIDLSLTIVPLFDRSGTLIGASMTARDVTEQKRAEETLRKLTRAVEQSPATVVITDLAGTIEYVNPKFTETTGYSAEEAIGRNPRILKSGETSPEEYASLWRTVLAGGEWHGEFRNRKKSGEQYWERASISPIRAPDGAITHLLAVKEDITGQKRTEERMRLANMVFETTTEAIMVADADGRIKAVNPAFTEITGYRPEEVIGESARILDSGRHDAGFFAAVAEATARDGKWQGEVWNRRKDGEVYLQWMSTTALRDHRGRVIEYASIFTDITQRKQDEQKIWRQANYDALTGLPNRTLFLDRLAHALAVARRNRHQVALMFLDLDRFKAINDSLGHSAGDRLLELAARRIVSAVRESDTVARLGGDEFTVVLSALRQASDAEKVANKILNALAPAFEVEGHEVFVSGSVGITIYPEDATDIEGLLRNADTAMYRAKEGGRNLYRFFTHTMNAEVQERLRLDTDLRHALERGEFRLEFQPILELATGRAVTAEALIRWQSPERGLVMPSAFIPAAEETGLVLTIDAWALASACREAKLWRGEGLADLRVSVNLSSRRFRQGDAADFILSVLEEEGIGPEAVTIEIPEALLLEASDATVAQLERIRGLGVQLTVDDFGTGHSSLGYIRRLPIDTIKIDRSFVGDLTLAAGAPTMAEAIIALAHSLGIKVLAVGVETPEQLAFLRARGCDLAQGYLFCRPIAGPEFVAYLKQARGRASAQM